MSIEDKKNPNNPTIAIQTLGCKVNQFESACFRSALEAKGVQVVPFSQAADVYVVNTCAVTAKAGAQSRQVIRQAMKRNPRARLVVTGCYAQIAAQDVLEMVEQPLCIVGNGFKDHLVEVAVSGKQCDLEMFMGDIRRKEQICDLRASSFGDRTRAFLKIQDGCNSFCSYCIVPYARGRSRSYLPDQVIDQARRFIDRGFKEIVITGIHTGLYGRDLEQQTSLFEILPRLLALNEDVRYRISSLEPGEISDDLLILMAENPNLMPHLHIPLQSGDAGILKKMNRKYGPDYFNRRVRRCLEMIPDMGIGVDVLVGFPGEDERAFDKTYTLLHDLPVTYLHVFPYSQRPGTPAAVMDGQVEKSLKDERVARLRELDNEKRQEFYSRFLGRQYRVLVEGGSPKGRRMKGFTDNYIPVTFSGSIDLVNRFVEVRLEDVHGPGVSGKIIEEQ